MTFKEDPLKSKKPGQLYQIVRDNDIVSDGIRDCYDETLVKVLSPILTISEPSVRI
jgi:hypothetical protein